MAGIKAFSNETQDNAGLAPGQLPGEQFSTYLARIHATWTKGTKRTSGIFAAVTLNPAHTAHPDISENYLDWLNRFAGQIEGKGKNKAVIANLDLEGASPVRVQPGQITNHTEEKLTAQTALAMATLALADPKMQKKGVTLEGSDEEKMLLLHALKQIGFTGKIHNAPDKKKPEYDKAALAILGTLPGFIAHVGGKAQPDIPPGPPAPPAAPPPPPPSAGTPPVASNFAANATQPASVDIFNQVIGDLMMNVYGRKFTPEQHKSYENARNEAAKEQAAELVAKEGMTQEEADALVAAPNRSMPKSITPFAALLMPKLPRDFFPKEIKADALRLQTAGRTLGILQGDIDPGEIASPNIFDGDPDDLKTLQRGLKDLLDKFPEPGSNPKARAEALEALHGLQGRAMAAGDTQAAATIGKLTHLFDQTGQKLHATQKAGLSAPKNVN